MSSAAFFREWLKGLPVLVIVALYLWSGTLMAGQPYVMEGYVHAETGVALPNVAAGMSRGKTGPYPAESGADGVIISYSNDDAEATVYIRRLQPDETAATAESIVRRTFAAVKTLEEKGMYSSVEALKVAEEKLQPGWATMAFVARAGDRGEVASYIYARIKDGFAFKLRITTTNRKSPAVMKFAEEFRRRVEKEMRKSE